MHPAVRRLLAWYRRHKRELPWRQTRNPYRIFVSELMLQQTQVERVIELYHRFLHDFPTWNSLAKAPTHKLIHAWAGLGYNRRALYAREAAKDVVAKGVPTSKEGWRSLKGVGPYMSASLTAFVNHKAATVIDTNIRRVVGRVFLNIAYPTLDEDARIARVLETITPTQLDPAILPQAFMDLGATICVARTPKCAICPIQKECRSAKRFLSPRPPQPPLRHVHERIHRDKKYPDRIYRGKILAIVREKMRVSINEGLGKQIDLTFDPIADSEWLQEMCKRMEKDGLVSVNRGILRFPA